MPSKSKTPHDGGELQNSFAGLFCDEGTVKPGHRQAALTLLCACPELSHKEAGFLGNLCVAPKPSTKQRAWLAKLLNRHGLRQLTEGGEQ